MKRSVLVVAFVMLGAVACSPAPTGDSGTATGRFIVALQPAAGSPDVVSREQADRYGVRVEAVFEHALSGYAAEVPLSMVEALRADPAVEEVIVDEQFQAQATPGCPICDVSQITARGARRIGADASSTHSGDGVGSVDVNVAVLDSGIQLDQPDLNVVGGANCVGGKGYSDVEGHGTIVAGVIAAKDNSIGIVGVAPGARLWSVQVLDKSLRGSTRSVLCGIDWVTGTRTDTDPTNDIQVANMSLAGPINNANTGKLDDELCGTTQHDLVHQAICGSTAAGATYVAGAGNAAADFRTTGPASYAEVLAVAAMADGDGAPGGLTPDPCENFADDAAAPFSNFATLSVDTIHTVAAPGVCIASTYLGSDVAVDTGTSYASPFVAGTVALCISAGPCAGLTPAQIVSTIVADASTYAAANPSAGFTGDREHPTPGKYYGPLIRSALY